MIRPAEDGGWMTSQALTYVGFLGIAGFVACGGESGRAEAGASGEAGERSDAGEGGTTSTGKGGTGNGGTMSHTAGGVGGAAGGGANSGAPGLSGDAGDGGATSGSAGLAGDAGGSGGSAGRGGEAGADAVPQGGDGTGGAAGANAAGGGAGEDDDAGEGGSAGELGEVGGNGNSAGEAGAASDAGASGAGGAPSTRVCPEVYPNTAFFYLSSASTPNYAAYAAVVRPNISTPAVDFFLIDFFSQAATTSGHFALGVGEQENFATCLRCVSLSDGSASGRFFFATSGTLEMEQAADVFAGSLTATLRDVTYVEVTLGEDSLYVPVPDGECFHVTLAQVAVPAAK
jgi:hypothetical protein